MPDPRALCLAGLVVVGVVLAVVLTEHHGDGSGGGGPPPQYTGAPAVLLESFSWKPLLVPPSQPLLFWGIDGATAAYDSGSSQCWALADGGSRWTMVPATGQQPQLGDSLYTNSVASTGGGYVVASSGAVWVTLDCQEWSKAGHGVPLTSPRTAAKLFSLPDPSTAAPQTLVYAGGRTAGACDTKAFASDNGQHWTAFKLPELPRGCLPAFSTSGGDEAVLYFGASSVWEASGALAGGHVTWTQSCYLSGTVNEVVLGPLILPTQHFPSFTDSRIDASVTNATAGAEGASIYAWVSVFTVDDGIAQPSTAYSYSTDSCAWSSPKSNPPWTAKYGGGTAQAVSTGAGRYALCGGYAASGRSMQLPECWLSSPVYVEHTDDPSIPTVTHRPTQSHSSTSSSTPTPTSSPTPTDSITPSSSQSSTPSITPSPSNSPTLPPSPSPTPSNTPSPSNSPTLPPSPSHTPSHSPTISFSPTPHPSPSPAPARASAAAASSAGTIAGAVCGSVVAALAGALLYMRCKGRQGVSGGGSIGHGSGGSGGAELNESLLGVPGGVADGRFNLPLPSAPPQQPPLTVSAAARGSAIAPPLTFLHPSARAPQPAAQPNVFECPVDLCDFVDPVTAPCGHTLCRECYIGWLARGGVACPTCRSPLPRQPPAINIIIREAQAAASQRRPAPALAVINEAHLEIVMTPAGLLGEGGFGEVRRGWWRGTPVAVKSLKRDAAEVGEAPARAFDREMQVLAQLKHPNVVPVFGVCHHADGHLSLVEELEEGGTLHMRLHPIGGGAPVLMSPREVIHVGLDVARALSFAHAAGVTHNDVKSVNVLFKNDGTTAVLADFGLARRVRSALPSTFGAMLNTSFGGAGLLGTYTYCAPENMDEQSTGYGQPPGDVFSLGMLLYEMCNGSSPWGRTSMVRVIDDVRAGIRPEFFFVVDVRLRALVERCWAQEARARPTAQEVVGALAVLEAEVG